MSILCTGHFHEIVKVMKRTLMPMLYTAIEQSMMFCMILYARLFSTYVVQFMLSILSTTKVVEADFQLSCESVYIIMLE